MNRNEKTVKFNNFLKLEFGDIRYAEYLNINDIYFYDILLLPGANDFIELLNDFSSKLSNQNFRVVVIDHPGQGLSTRYGSNRLIRHIKSYNYYFDTIEKIIQHKALGEKRPLIFIGHSLGGFLSISYLLKSKLLNVNDPIVLPEKIITITPMMSLIIFKIDKFLVNFINFFLKIINLSNLGFPRQLIKLFILLKITHKNVINNISLSSNSWKKKENIQYYGLMTTSKILNIYKRYPGLDIAGPSWNWTDLTIKLCDKLKNSSLIKSIKIPVLIIYAENEDVVNPTGIEFLIKNLENKQILLLKNSKHSVFNESEEINRVMFERIYKFIISK